MGISADGEHHHHQQHQETKRRTGFLPKIKRAFEAATYASNGSFPVQEPPRSPGEESEMTAFEADDSVSQCTSQSVADSCTTLASYDMSRIDADAVPAMEPCDLVHPSPTASDVDSLFGVNIRDMATQESGEGGEDRDDVWLLSTTDDIRVDAPPTELKSPAASILSKVPVLVLPVLPERTAKSNRISNTINENWVVESESEEEIEFDDSTCLISESEDQQNLIGNSDENRNNNIMMRAQILGKNLKGIWSGTDCGKRVKLAKRKYRKARKKKSKQKASSSPPPQSMDPLKELSKCHEKMLQNTKPFSPKRAFSRMRDRIRKDISHDSSHERQHAVLLSMSSSVSSVDEASELTLPSELYPSISNNTTLTLDAGPSAASDKAVASSHPSQESPNSSTNAVKEPHSGRKNHSKPPPSFKINFKSPRNDTPRIVLGDEVSASDSGEEPRALYTDEGYVEAYIHPKICSSGSMSSRNSLNHVFHSELSTLYEVSSSLESASFISTASASAASTEATSMCATAGNNSRHLPFQTASSSTTSESSSSTNQDETLISESSPSDTALLTEPNAKMHDQCSEIEADVYDNFVDDREVKMRWEFSLGLMEDQGLWRQPNMPLMNTEEMAHDYVAEI